jgi:hypothetical protein
VFDDRPSVLRRPVEGARDLEDFAWRQAQVDLYARLIGLLGKLGIWIFWVAIVQFVMAVCIAFLVVKAL